jgi:hypothetical protein
VVAKAELPQSYMVQAQIAFFLNASVIWLSS